MIFSLDVTNIFIYRGKNKNNRMFSFRRCKGREKEADVPLMAYMGMNLGYGNKKRKHFECLRFCMINKRILDSFFLFYTFDGLYIVPMR